MNTSTPSSLTEYNLNNQANRISVYVYPIIMVFILVTNIINVSVLCRRPLRSSSCTHYFLALGVVSLIYIPIAPLSTVLSNGFNISIYSSPVGCRIQSFVIFSSVLYFTVTLVFASADRYCASSSTRRLRSFSSPHIARRVILISALVTMIYISPFCLTNYWDNTTNRCVQYSTTVIVVYLSSRVVLYYMVGPLTMAVFGMLTIRNIRTHRNRVVPIGGQNRYRRTDGQLSRMLIIQVGSHLLFSLPVAVTYTLLTFIPSLNTPFINGLRTIAAIWQTGTFFLSFFFYILSANVYRQELKKIFSWNRNRGEGIHRVAFFLPRLLTRNIIDTRA